MCKNIYKKAKIIAKHCPKTINEKENNQNANQKCIFKMPSQIPFFPNNFLKLVIIFLLL